MQHSVLGEHFWPCQNKHLEVSPNDLVFCSLLFFSNAPGFYTVSVWQLCTTYGTDGVFQSSLHLSETSSLHSSLEPSARVFCTWQKAVMWSICWLLNLKWSKKMHERVMEQHTYSRACDSADSRLKLCANSCKNSPLSKDEHFKSCCWGFPGPWISL